MHSNKNCSNQKGSRDYFFLPYNKRWSHDPWYYKHPQDYGTYRWNECYFSNAGKAAIDNDKQKYWGLNLNPNNSEESFITRHITNDRSGKRTVMRYVPPYFLDNITHAFNGGGDLLVTFEFDRKVKKGSSTPISNRMISLNRLKFKNFKSWGFPDQQAHQLFSSNVETKTNINSNYIKYPKNNKSRSYFLNHEARNNIRNFSGLLNNESLAPYLNTLQVSDAETVTIKLPLENDKLDYLRRIDFKVREHNATNTLAPESTLYPYRFWDKDWTAGPGTNNQHPSKNANNAGKNDPAHYEWYVHQSQYQPNTNTVNFVYDDDYQIGFGNGYWTVIQSDSLPENPLDDELHGIRMISYGDFHLKRHHFNLNTFGIDLNGMKSSATAFLLVPHTGRYSFQTTESSSQLSIHRDGDSDEGELVPSSNLDNLSLQKGDIVFIDLQSNQRDSGRAAVQWKLSLPPPNDISASVSDDQWMTIPRKYLYLSEYAAQQSKGVNEIDSKGNSNIRNIQVFSNYKIPTNIDHTYIEACATSDCSTENSPNVVSNIDRDLATPDVISATGQRSSDDLFTDYRREFHNDSLTSWSRDDELPENNSTGYSSMFELHVLKDLYAEPSESIWLRLGNPLSSLVAKNILPTDTDNSLLIPVNDASPSLSITNS